MTARYEAFRQLWLQFHQQKCVPATGSDRRVYRALVLFTLPSPTFRPSSRVHLTPSGGQWTRG